MGQFGEISEGIVGQHPDLIVAQIPGKKKEREGNLKIFFSHFSETCRHTCILFTV